MRHARQRGLDRMATEWEIARAFMLAASDPNLIIGGLAAGGLALAALWRLLVWVRDAPRTPDPWDTEVEQKMQAPETPEVCPHCSTPQPPAAWFCSHCGSAVGPYNNLMPYVQIFSEGEVMRNSVSGRFRNRRLIAVGSFLMMLAINPIFAPIYLFLLWSNLKRSRHGTVPAEGQNAP